MIELKPHPNMKKIYLLYFLIAFSTAILIWAIPLLVFIPPTRPILIPVIVVAAATVPYWISRYYDSIRYVLGEDGLEVEYGVWWRKRSYIPYNRITNLHVAQGPISRLFGVASLGIQTAGFSAPSSGRSVGGKVAEAVLGYLKMGDLERVRGLIVEKIRGMRPQAVEAGEWTPGEEPLSQILWEVRQIRRLLEKREA